MFQFSPGLADADADDKPVVQLRMGDEYLTAFVKFVEKSLVKLIAAPVAEADQVERDRRDDFEMLISLDPFSQLPGSIRYAGVYGIADLPHRNSAVRTRV